MINRGPVRISDGFPLKERGNDELGEIGSGREEQESIFSPSKHGRKLMDRFRG